MCGAQCGWVRELHCASHCQWYCTVLIFGSLSQFFLHITLLCFEQFGEDDNGDIKRTWETIRENIRISAKESIGLCESKSYKPSFDEESLKLVDQRKQAKL
jgi:hypothetical protein